MSFLYKSGESPFKLRVLTEDEDLKSNLLKIILASGPPGGSFSVPPIEDC